MSISLSVVLDMRTCAAEESPPGDDPLLLSSEEVPLPPREQNPSGWTH